MKSKIEAILEKVSEIKKRLTLVMGMTHSQEDYAIYLKNIGSEFEKFLKDAVFNNTKNNLNLIQLIEELSNEGISQNSIDKFHLLRSYYNSLKHNPNFSTSVIYAEEIINNLHSGLSEIKEKSIGKINKNYIRANSRVLWFYAWDDYAGGMTELNLFLPNYELDFSKCGEYLPQKYKVQLLKNKYYDIEHTEKMIRELNIVVNK